jgi:hypothetical protein
MNQQEYFEFHKTMCDRARAISAAKNNDYSAPQKRGDDPFAVFGSFMQAERLNICTVPQGFLVRISDKLSRLCNLLTPGHNQTVKDESVTDTALDTINYLLLLLGYLETKRAQCTESGPASPLVFGPAPEDPLTGYAQKEKRTEEQVTKKDSIRETLLSIASEFGLALRCPVGGDADPFGEIFYFVDEVKQLRSPTFSLKLFGLNQEAETSRIREVLSDGPPDWLTAPIPVAQSVCGRVEEQVAEDLAPPPEVDEHFSTWFVEWLLCRKDWHIVTKLAPKGGNPPEGGFTYIVANPKDADGVRFPSPLGWVRAEDPRTKAVGMVGIVYYPRAALKQYEHEARSAYVADLKKELL